MFSRFGKYRRGSAERLQAENNELCSENTVQSVEKEMKTKKISRRSRSKNIVKMVNSDCDEDLKSVNSDNPHLYTRSRSSNTLDNTSTKKYLLQSRGKTFVNVESKMKSIENSLSNIPKYEPTIFNVRNETKERNYVVHTLKKEITMKDQFIYQLNDQLNHMKKQTSNLGNNHHLEHLETQMDGKILQMQEKHAKVSRMKQDKNIDNKIDMAELEYKIEKDQLDILNISQKIQLIKMNLEKQKYTKELTKKEFLYSYVKDADSTIVISCEISNDSMGCLSIRQGGFGVSVTKDCQDLKIGDRLLELDEVNVFKITTEDWENMKPQLGTRSGAVFLRTKANQNGYYNKNKDLKDDIAIIQYKLEQKLTDGRNVSIELERVQKEKTAMFHENIRLNHRIAYLEEHTQELQLGLQQVRDSLSRTLNTEIHDALSILGKKDQTKDKEDNPTCARSGSSTSGVYSSAASDRSDSPRSNNSSTQEAVERNSVFSRTSTNEPAKDSDYVSRLAIGVNLTSFANV